MKYFIIQNNEQLGPYNLDELQNKNVEKNTLVWFEGLSDWTKAIELSELEHLFIPKVKIPPPIPETEKKSTPPPSPNYHIFEKVNTEQNQQQKNSVKTQNNNKIYGLLIFTLIFVLSLFFIFSTSKNSNSNQESEVKDEIDNIHYNDGSYEKENDKNYESYHNNEKTLQNQESYKPNVKSEEELQEELKQKEGRNPLKYLDVTFSLEYKVLSGKDKITGSVYNSAKLAEFTNVILEVSYSNAYDVFLGSERFKLDTSINPSSSSNFTIKVLSPTGTRKIGVKVVSAELITYEYI